MSIFAPTISAVRLWKSRFISVSFVVEINVSPLNLRIETFENKYCPMVMLSFHS